MYAHLNMTAHTRAGDDFSFVDDVEVDSLGDVGEGDKESDGDSSGGGGGDDGGGDDGGDGNGGGGINSACSNGGNSSQGPRSSFST